jgi:hypothetical protein
MVKHGLAAYYVVQTLRSSWHDHCDDVNCWEAISLEIMIFCFGFQVGASAISDH